MMENDEVEFVGWSLDSMLEVSLGKPDDFRKTRETLTRIGVPSRKAKILYQSCHIFHKRERYYIVHFKEMFLLDGKQAKLTVDDVQRRNTIANLLAEWNLVSIVNPEQASDTMPMRYIKVLSHKEKAEWELVPKYTMGGG